MTKYFQDHNPAGIASEYFGGLIHRVATRLTEGMSDADLVHAIYKSNLQTKANRPWDYGDYYTNLITMENMSADAKAMNMDFYICNKTHWDMPNISVELFARASGAIADKLEQDGWTYDNAGILLFNEPGKFVTEEEYVQFVVRSNDYVKGRFKLVIINDEYHVFDENKVFTLLAPYNIPGLVFGVHHLSSLDSDGHNTVEDCNWQNIQDAATQAASWGVPVFNTEGGAWMHAYQSNTGHAINMRMFEECKTYGYMGCALMTVDNNTYTISHTSGQIAYRRWDYNYQTNVNSPVQENYWQKLIAVLKENKEKVPIPIEEEDMKLDSLYYKDRPEEKYIRDPEKRGVKFLRACFGLSDSNNFDNALDAKVREYQSTNGMLVDGKVGPETFGGLILEADYQKYYNWVQHDWATYSK